MSASGNHVLATNSGREIDLDNPSPDSIAVEDIAAALSKVCRFGAQATRFYSVAQHAVLVSELVSDVLGRPDLAGTALHHDSHEAYACDIPRPLKLKLRDGAATSVYDEVCARLDATIAVALGVPPFDPASADGALVHKADDMALAIESQVLLAGGLVAVRGGLSLTDEEIVALPVLPEPLDSASAEAVFLTVDARLRG